MSKGTKSINLDFLIKDLTGKEIEDAHAGKMVANALVADSKTKEPLKFFSWAQKLYDKGVLELDGDDEKKFKSAVEEIAFPVLTKAQILNVL
jgi:hypothetical protein